MRNTFLMGFATLALVVCAPAFAQTGTAQSQIQTQPSPAMIAPVAPTGDGDKIVCKSMPADTGSRIGGRRVCQPASVWAQQTADARKQIELQQGRGLNMAGPSN